MWFLKQVRGSIRQMALAVGILAYGLPLCADTLAVSPGVTQDRPSTLHWSRIGIRREFPSIGADLLCGLKNLETCSPLLRSLQATLSMGWQTSEDDRSESAEVVSVSFSLFFRRCFAFDLPPLCMGGRCFRPSRRY